MTSPFMMMPLATLAADTFSHYGPVGILILMAIVFGFGALVVPALMAPKRTGDIKGGVYESGMNPIGSARRRFNVRFYLVAMSFLVFDVEIIFLIPWGTVFPSLAKGSDLLPWFLGRMLFFIATTFIAYFYAWRKGIFRYD
jgi:NADH-quinone oxidoreductase subunit A